MILLVEDVGLALFGLEGLKIVDLGRYVSAFEVLLLFSLEKSEEIVGVRQFEGQIDG